MRVTSSGGSVLEFSGLMGVMLRSDIVQVFDTNETKSSPGWYPGDLKKNETPGF